MKKIIIIFLISIISFTLVYIALPYIKYVTLSVYYYIVEESNKGRMLDALQLPDKSYSINRYVNKNGTYSFYIYNTPQN